MISRYNERLRELKDKPAEMYDYMARCAPYLLEHETSKNKKDLFKKFMNDVEGCPDYSEPVCLFSNCENCGSFDVFFDDYSSDVICRECGTASFTLTGERSYKEEQESDQRVVYSYKRENHFNEWLAQFQAKEMTSVPDEVFELLRNEFKKQKLLKNEITHPKVRDMLKKLKMSKYYEHVPYITSMLNGIVPPQMDQALEDKLRVMFHHIQEPFRRSKPDERKNFLSYSYILYKFCELLSEDKYLVCFPLLKSKEKLYKQDQIWKKITEELQWEFIPTI